MGPQYLKGSRKLGVSPANLVERLKKMRALNCSPSDIGMDNYVVKKLLFNKVSLLTRKSPSAMTF